MRLAHNELAHFVRAHSCLPLSRRYWRSSGTTGSALLWEQAAASLGRSALTAAVSYAHAQGAVVLVSAGGPSESPYAGNASAYGAAAAAWASANGLDGVDFALGGIETGFAAGSTNSSSLVDWISAAANAAAAGLAAASPAPVRGCGGSRLVTHTIPVSLRGLPAQLSLEQPLPPSVATGVVLWTRRRNGLGRPARRLHVCVHVSDHIFAPCHRLGHYSAVRWCVISSVASLRALTTLNGRPVLQAVRPATPPLRARSRPPLAPLATGRRAFTPAPQSLRSLPTALASTRSSSESRC